MRPRRPSAAGRARKWTRRRPWRGAAPPADPTSSRATGCPSVPRIAMASASSCTGAVTWDGVTVSGAASAGGRPPAALPGRREEIPGEPSWSHKRGSSYPREPGSGFLCLSFIDLLRGGRVARAKARRQGSLFSGGGGHGPACPFHFLACSFWLLPEVLAIPIIYRVQRMPWTWVGGSIATMLQVCIKVYFFISKFLSLGQTYTLQITYTLMKETKRTLQCQSV